MSTSSRRPIRIKKRLTFRKKRAVVKLEDLWEHFQNQPLHVLLDQDPFDPSTTSTREKNIGCRKLMKSAYKMGRMLGSGNVGRVFEISFKKMRAEERIKEYTALSQQRGPNEMYPWIVKVQILHTSDEDNNLLNNEVTVSFLITLMILSGVSFGFVRTIDWFRCDFYDSYSRSCRMAQYIIQERATTTMQDFIQRNPLRTCKQIRSIYFQVMHALVCAQEWYYFTHGSLHLQNVMVLDMKTPERQVPNTTTLDKIVWSFNLWDTEPEYLIPALDLDGYAIKIIDFGRSYINYANSIFVAEPQDFDARDEPLSDIRGFTMALLRDHVHFLFNMLEEDTEDPKELNDLVDLFAFMKNESKKHFIRNYLGEDYEKSESRIYFKTIPKFFKDQKNVRLIDLLHKHPFFEPYRQPYNPEQYPQHVVLSKWMDPNSGRRKSEEYLLRGDDWKLPHPFPHCDNCDKLVSISNGFVCGGTCGGKTVYCDVSCQQTHWIESHSQTCKHQ